MTIPLQVLGPNRRAVLSSMELLPSSGLALLCPQCGRSLDPALVHQVMDPPPIQDRNPPPLKTTDFGHRSWELCSKQGHTDGSSSWGGASVREV